jgi:Ca2+-dependent lipid-binding protein
LQTKVFNRKKGAKDTNCIFNETFLFGAQWPMAYDKLVVKVCDKENFGSPTILGSIILNLKEIVKKY